MVSFLATADLHLKESEASDRLEVLRWLCERAVEESVAGIFVAGDLFDSESDARALVSDVKDVFSESLPDGLPVVMVPGNHDENLHDLGWPRRVTVLERGQTVSLEADGESLHVHGLPYDRGGSFESVGSVFDLDTDGTHLLISHASFLSPKHRHLLAKIDESDEDNNYVLHADDFRDSGFDQILLGHWHGFQPLMESPPVHYVGAPVPNSRNEEGRKGYLIGSVEAGRVNLSREDLDAPPGWYYENREELVVPGYEDALLDRLGESLESESGCRFRLTLRGYTKRDSESFRREVRSRLDEVIPEGASATLDAELQSADEMDAPMVDRIFEAIEAEDPGEVLSIEDLVSPSEPDKVVSVMKRLLEEDPGSVKHRARQFFLESLVGTMDS